MQIKMLFLGILVVLLGVSAAIDMTGCDPQQPFTVYTNMGQQEGIISSPGYKESQNYPDNVFCQYNIITQFGYRTKYTFLDMDVEPFDMCMTDAVEIIAFVGPQQQAQGLGVFCGNETYPPVITPQGVTASAIIFHSDFMKGGRGFRIKYEVSPRPSVCDHLGQMPCKNRKCYSTLDKCNGVDNCGDGTDEEGCGFPLKTTDCGVRKVTGLHSFDRVIGGKEAVPGSWPWQADLQLAQMHPNGHMCGGTLINSQWVLSAAHCFGDAKDPGQWRIHLGNHHKFKTDATEQVRYGERIILYPGTTGNDLYNLHDVDMQHDMALIKLNAPVKFTDQVRPACLPTQGYEVPIGTKCMATGWGMTRGSGASHVLKEVELTIQDPEVCNGMTGPINEATMICVKNSRGFQDVCHGDSGGPLVCQINGKWNVMGATSFGSDGNMDGGLCAMPSAATIYSKASHKTNWIIQQMNKYT